MDSMKKKSPLNFIVGLVVVFLVIVGLFSIVGFLGDKIGNGIKEKNEAKYTEYENFIAPVIMNDPDTFDDITKADMQQLLSIAIWSVLSSGADPESYEYSDSGMLIPQSEIEEMFTSLFGSEVEIRHSTVDGGEGVEFKYSEKKNCYVIPITGITPIYTPDVVDATEKSSSIVLKVGYLASTEWVQDSDGNIVPPEPGKYMTVTLSKNSDGSYFVRSIQPAD